MKKIFYRFIFAFFIALSFQGNCQYNMVPSPSFEVYDTCPHSFAQLRYCPPWNTPLNTTPDYNNSCDTGFQTGFIAGVPNNFHGFQYARSGNGYAGIATYSHNLSNPTNYREYLQVPLLDSMINGVEYFLRFYVSPGDSCRYVSNTMGVFFSNITIDTLIFPSAPLPFTPQFVNPISNSLYDRNLWTEISGTYVATGGEKFILIGNFNNYMNTDVQFTGWGSSATKSFAYYYVDDVLVAPTDSLTSIIEINSNEELALLTLNNNEFKINSKYIPINSYEVINRLGQIIDKKVKVNENSVALHMQDIANGIYFVRVRLQNEKIHILKLFNP